MSAEEERSQKETSLLPATWLKYLGVDVLSIAVTNPGEFRCRV
jgi:hypothetical protein